MVEVHISKTLSSVRQETSSSVVRQGAVGHDGSLDPWMWDFQKEVDSGDAKGRCVWNGTGGLA